MRVALSELADSYDLIVIGGGITGAGILREAVRTGARVLLVEARDFASGTSSWSSKLVHGGLRYLKEGQWRLTLESVRERQRLIAEVPGLIEPLQFLMPIRRDASPGRRTMQMGLALYDLMGGRRRSGWYDAAHVLQQLPWLLRERLLGAVHYEDARTDDARLVMRLILEAIAGGGQALNYVRASITTAIDGRVDGVSLRDSVDGASRRIRSQMVINATGVWAEGLSGAPAGAPPLRPLRGSHLIFPTAVLPLPAAVSWLHPRDRRPIFAYPWEGATVFGTTDLDHDQPLDDPCMTPEEEAYLMEGLHAEFPGLSIAAHQALSRYAGVRPVIASGKANPSAESRESAQWVAPGLIGITGGKLTTFRVTAHQVLSEAARQCPVLKPARKRAPLFRDTVSPALRHPRISARFGAQSGRLIADSLPQELEPIGETPYCWAELRWAATHEHVVHLQDLLMRRTRLGLVSPQGGAVFLDRIGAICRSALGWDDTRWGQERQAYLDYWQQHHAPAPLERA